MEGLPEIPNGILEAFLDVVPVILFELPLAVPTLFLCLFLIYYVSRSQSNAVVSGAEAMIGQVATITTYRDQLGEYGKMWLEPSDLLVKLAQEGGSFRSYNAKA